MDRSTATLRPKTPSSAASSTSNYRSFQTPRSNVSSRPVSRQSDVFRAPSRQAAYPKAPDLGDMVSIDTAQLKAEGVLRFLGTTEFKAGIWAGVELFPDYVEKGKNDGEVQGVRYFTCAPKTGVFVLATAIKVINDRPDSVASGRFTPVSGRQTPPLKLQQPNRPGSLFKTPEALRVTPGSRASKYVGMTAKDLAARKAEARTGSTSPTRKIQHSPTRSVTSAFPTPKASSTRPTASGLQGPTPRRSHPATSLVTPRAAPARGATAMSPPPVPGSASSFMNRSPSRRTAGTIFCLPQID
ncbi:hypothetical protein DL93DRAFT_2050833 [Clavulina sp. PMI_390]|nr:hypothetical protein DL93DRAFT_2050833 [Clavulina sp. PMI_390]